MLYTVVVRSFCYSISDAYCNIKHGNLLHIYEYVIDIHYLNVWAIKPWYQIVNSYGCWLYNPNEVHMYNHLHNIHYTWGPWKQYFKCHREASIRGTHCTTAQVSHITRYIGGTKPRRCRLRGTPTTHSLPPRNHANTHSSWTSSLYKQPKSCNLETELNRRSDSSHHTMKSNYYLT